MSSVTPKAAHDATHQAGERARLCNNPFCSTTAPGARYRFPMPVYLPPISRRRFLKGSLAASAFIVAGGCATHKSITEGQSWALLSDIHIAADPKLVRGNVNMTRNLQRVADEVVAWPGHVSGVLINGDLAYDGGEVADYIAVLGLLRPIREHGLPIHLALGNHDHRERFWATLPQEKLSDANLPERQTAIVRTEYANWFMLDSLIKTRETPGRLGDAQRAWLARALDENADKPALIAIHHHPAFAAATSGLLEKSEEMMGILRPLESLIGAAGSLEDTAELMEILRPRRHVKAYFFGHTHRWSVDRDESGLCLVNFPPVAYVFEKGRPNGWVQAILQPEGARLELRCLDHAHKDHGQVVNLDWRA
jgi:3',5'-cyclic AMP phosphodiesterase CpdA